MAFGMWMVRAEMWVCRGFTRDPGASYCSIFSLDGAVNGILRFVLQNLEVHMHSRFWWCPAPLEHSIHQQGKHPFSPG